MTRLIDVDRLIFHSCNDMKGDCPYWGSANCGVCQKSLITRAEIDNAPTVEYPFYAEAYQTGYEEGKNERQKGVWIMNKTSARGRNYTCTNCKKVSRNKFDFCPNCGADMMEDGKQ